MAYNKHNTRIVTKVALMLQSLRKCLGAAKECERSTETGIVDRSFPRLMEEFAARGFHKKFVLSQANDDGSDTHRPKEPSTLQQIVNQKVVGQGNARVEAHADA